MFFFFSWMPSEGGGGARPIRSKVWKRAAFFLWWFAFIVIMTMIMVVISGLPATQQSGRAPRWLGLAWPLRHLQKDHHHHCHHDIIIIILGIIIIIIGIIIISIIIIVITFVEVQEVDDQLCKCNPWKVSPTLPPGSCCPIPPQSSALALPFHPSPASGQRCCWSRLEKHARDSFQSVHACRNNLSSIWDLRSRIWLPTGFSTVAPLGTDQWRNWWLDGQMM